MEEILPSESDQLQLPIKKPRSLVLPLTLLLLGVSLGSGYLYLETTYPALFKQIYERIIPPRQAASTTAPASSPEPTRSPYPVLPDAGTAGTFKISQGTHTGPTFTDLMIDPLDAKVGDQMTISIQLTSPTPVISVTAKLLTDGGIVDLTFQKISRDGETEKWRSTFDLTQSVLYNYKLTLYAQHGETTSQVSMAIRQ